MGEGLAQRNKTEKLTVAALLTAVFAVTALLFKGFVIYLYHQVTELRPVNAFPLIFYNIRITPVLCFHVTLIDDVNSSSVNGTIKSSSRRLLYSNVQYSFSKGIICFTPST